MSCIPPHLKGHFPDVSYKKFMRTQCVYIEYDCKITKTF